MRYRLLICLALTVFVAACQGPPPTQIVLVVTATPGSEAQQTEEAASTAEVQQATEEPTDLPPTSTTTRATPTLDPFPTPTLSQIQVAEQVFEHGRMMWIQPLEQIWVMVDDGSEQGTWSAFDDVFADGEAEFDPSLVPPEGMFQPERGFGKLWRENQELHDALGWGLTPEFGYVSNYEYYPGGTVEQGQYVRGPGYHILFSLSQEKFQFNEADFTWKKI